MKFIYPLCTCGHNWSSHGTSNNHLGKCSRLMCVCQRYKLDRQLSVKQCPHCYKLLRIMQNDKTGIYDLQSLVPFKQSDNDDYQNVEKGVR